MNTYSEEYKIEAVKRALASDSAASIAKELGINKNSLYTWISKYKNNTKERVFPGKGHLSPEDERVRLLEKEIRDLREENEILKRSVKSA